MDVHKGRTSRTLFRRATAKQTESYNSFIQMCVAQCHCPPLVGMYTIDDYSCKTWLYLLKSKDEVFIKFKEFKVLIENLSERKIKTLRSDNGGEYTSKEFVNFYKDVGIKREITTPYNPQQNSVVERKNRTIMEVVKTMIHDQDIPMHLWDEATRTSFYV